MPKQPKFNDAQIRAESVTVEQLAHNIQSQALLLSEKFDALYVNLKYADPIKDAAFDRYMITMAHCKMMCDQMPSLAHQAHEMQTYGLPKVQDDLSHLNRHVGGQVATCPVAGRRGLTPLQAPAPSAEISAFGNAPVALPA
jgi:hypothetical protein